MTSDSPLASYPLVATCDVDEALAVVSRELTESRINQAKDSQRFRFEMNGISFGETLVGWNTYQTDIDIHSGFVGDTVGFVIGKLGPVFRMDEEVAACTPSTAAVVSRSRMSVERPAGSSIFVVKSTYQSLERRFQEVTGRLPRGRIRFDRMVDVSSGPGALARQTLMNVVSQLENGDAIVTNKMFRVAIDDLLLGVLLSLPHSHTRQLLDDPGDVAPQILHRAEEFIEAHFAEAIRIRDVIAECGCSSSLIYRAFQRYRGYTPSEFLASQRLEASRGRLLSPSQNDTVTSIALDCGFSHLSRFAASYQRRFGETPSATLRRSR